MTPHDSTYSVPALAVTATEGRPSSEEASGFHGSKSSGTAFNAVIFFWVVVLMVVLILLTAEIGLTAQCRLDDRPPAPAAVHPGALDPILVYMGDGHAAAGFNVTSGPAIEDRSAEYFKSLQIVNLKKEGLHS